MCLGLPIHEYRSLVFAAFIVPHAARISMRGTLLFVHFMLCACNHIDVNKCLTFFFVKKNRSSFSLLLTLSLRVFCEFRWNDTGYGSPIAVANFGTVYISIIYIYNLYSHSIQFFFYIFLFFFGWTLVCARKEVEWAKKNWAASVSIEHWFKITREMCLNHGICAERKIPPNLCISK